MEGSISKSNRISTSTELYHAPTPLQTLPPMNFTDPSHFSIIHTTIVHAIDDSNGNSFWSSVLLSNPFTSGVVSITITILSLPNETLCFGLMDSTSPIPKIDEVIGYNVKNSASLDQYGSLNYNTPSSNSSEYCHDSLHEGDCFRMEVDLDSTPRTLQFFVNGEAGRSYMSGIPSSVRIGFSVAGQGTSIRIDNIFSLSRPTPFSEEMEEVTWSI